MQAHIFGSTCLLENYLALDSNDLLVYVLGFKGLWDLHAENLAGI